MILFKKKWISDVEGNKLFIFSKQLFIEIWLIYNVLVSTVQQGDSVFNIFVHFIYIFFSRFLETNVF